MFDQQTHIYLNPVAVDRAEEFETFLFEVVAPALAAQRPELVDRWRVLKATAPETADPSVVTYAFLFDGGDLAEDWDLDKLLPAHYGQEEAERLGSAWMECFAPFQNWVDAVASRGRHEPQVGWTFTTVGARAPH
jgi:hypothetical protein